MTAVGYFLPSQADVSLNSTVVIRKAQSFALVWCNLQVICSVFIVALRHGAQPRDIQQIIGGQRMRQIK